MRKAEKTIDEALRQLEGYVTWHAQGKVPYLPALRVVKSAEGKDLPQPMSLRFPLSDDDCKRLISLGTLTPFGQGSQRKEDPKVRLGYQIDASQISLEDSEFTATFATSLASTNPPVATTNTEVSLDCPAHHPSMGTEMRHIRNSLCPAASSLRAELYKMVVYPEGGHFQLHRDTLRKPNHVGTLLVGLPTESHFTGGELQLHRPGHEMVQLTNNQWDARDMSASYVAFFTDVEHILLPVKSGYRVTLMYHLFAEGYAAPSKSSTFALPNLTLTVSPALVNTHLLMLKEIVAPKTVTVVMDETVYEPIRRTKTIVEEKKGDPCLQVEETCFETRRKKKPKHQGPQPSAAEQKVMRAACEAPKTLLSQVANEMETILKRLKQSHEAKIGSAQVKPKGYYGSTDHGRVFDQYPTHLGVMLQHRYSESNQQPQYLRGCDALLYHDLANLKDAQGRPRFHVQLQAVNIAVRKEWAVDEEAGYEQHLDARSSVTVTLEHAVIDRKIEENDKQGYLIGLSHFYLVDQDAGSHNLEKQLKEWVSKEEKDDPEAKGVEPAKSLFRLSGEVKFVGPVNLARWGVATENKDSQRFMGNEPADAQHAYQHVVLIISRPDHPLLVQKR